MVLKTVNNFKAVRHLSIEFFFKLINFQNLASNNTIYFCKTKQNWYQTSPYVILLRQFFIGKNKYVRYSMFFTYFIFIIRLRFNNVLELIIVLFLLKFYPNFVNFESIWILSKFFSSQRTVYRRRLDNGERRWFESRREPTDQKPSMLERHLKIFNFNKNFNLKYNRF